VDVLEFVTFGFGVVVAFLRRPVHGYTCHGLSGRGGASPFGQSHLFNRTWSFLCL